MRRRCALGDVGVSTTAFPTGDHGTLAHVGVMRDESLSGRPPGLAAFLNI